MYLLTLFIRLWMKNFCLMVIAVWYGPWCPANKELWYVLKLWVRTFLELPVNINWLCLRPYLSRVYPEQKVVDNYIIKCFCSDTILCFCTGWKFSICDILINVTKTSGMLICFYEVLCLDQ